MITIELLPTVDVVEEGCELDMARQGNGVEVFHGVVKVGNVCKADVNIAYSKLEDDSDTVLVVRVHAETASCRLTAPCYYCGSFIGHYKPDQKCAKCEGMKFSPLDFYSFRAVLQDEHERPVRGAKVLELYPHADQIEIQSHGHALGHVHKDDDYRVRKTLTSGHHRKATFIDDPPGDKLRFICDWCPALKQTQTC